MAHIILSRFTRETVGEIPVDEKRLREQIRPKVTPEIHFSYRVRIARRTLMVHVWLLEVKGD
jgi:hypothetical protein